eukprot:jgi/Antlo1/1834/1900
MMWDFQVERRSSTLTMNYNKPSPPKRHLNFYIHTILNYLRERREPVSFLEIKEELCINLIINPSLIQSLKKNPRVEVSSNSLKFKPLYDLRKRADLEALLTNAKEGIEYVDLVDSNPNIDEWIKMLSERILVLKDADESQVLFWNPLIVEKASSEVLELFHSVKVPNYTDLVSELKNAGLKVQKNEVTKKRPMLKIPGKKYKRKVKITNTHIKGLDLD